MKTTLTMQEISRRFSKVSHKLLAYGIDPDKISFGIQQESVLQQIEELRGTGVKWDDFAAELAEAHPTWAMPWRKRMPRAEKLINNWNQRDDLTPRPRDLAEHRFAAVTWYNQQSGIHSAGDNEKEIIEFYIKCCISDEYPEALDMIVDLDTDEVYARDSDFSIIITASLKGSEHTIETKEGKS